jgi:hypothetical protein
MEPIKVTIQLDVHGPNSANNTQLITTYFRSSFGCDQFATSGFDIAPLYNETPKQIAFKNGEQQIEERWIVDCVMQANPVGTVPQQFASTLKVGVISVNEKYPPA